jgi:nitrite reductase/ring-hydroxylating ferredoxin subunit
MIIQKDNLREGINKISDKLIVIKSENSFWAIKNECPHFGVALDKSDIVENGIKCHEHGIIFSLVTGENINREFEKCGQLKFFEIKEKFDKIVIIKKPN